MRSQARPEPWLFAGLTPASLREAEAPASLGTASRRAWANTMYAADLSARHNALGAMLRPGMLLDADLVGGELRLLGDGAPMLDRVFVNAAEGEFLLAQWKAIASRLTITERTDGRKLSKVFRTLALPDNPEVVEQVVAAVAGLRACEAEIRAGEEAMNALTFDLYGLSARERALVLAG